MTSESKYSDNPAASVGGQEDLHKIRDSGNQVRPGADNAENQSGNCSFLGYRCILHGVEPDENQVQTFIRQTALRQIHESAVSDLERELGGILLGAVRQQAQSYQIEIQAMLPVSTDDHGPSHFTFTADSWTILHQHRSEQYPDLQIVGWYHTHPELGAFYSSDDVVVHSAAFVLPWQVGLVLDPTVAEACLVGWHQSDELMEGESQLIGIDGFYEILDILDQRSIDWRFINPGLLKIGKDGLAGSRPTGRVFTPASEWPSLPPISPWWGVILGGAGLLISLALLIDRLLMAIK